MMNIMVTYLDIYVPGRPADGNTGTVLLMNVLVTII